MRGARREGDADSAARAVRPATAAEDWPRIRELLRAALERDPAQRPAFLDQACGEDAKLRQSVDALLAAHEEAGDFLESPNQVDRMAADVLGDEAAPALASGSRVGRYEILELLDTGGMGEVYRARDTGLHRDVAVKVMRPWMTRDTSRLRLFEKEARAAGAISDPNILAVFDVGAANGMPYAARPSPSARAWNTRSRSRRGSAPRTTRGSSTATSSRTTSSSRNRAGGKTLQMNPAFAEARRVSFLVRQRVHHDAEALADLETYRRQPDGGPGGSVGYAYAVLGRTGEAAAVLRELDVESRHRFVASYDFAVIHAGLGEADRALAWLDKSLTRHDPETMILPADPRFDSLRGDPRFVALLERMSLPRP
ncbi:MAG TPA: hypothetical protein VEQ84_16230 [Vicinamibacteria bacterium]|nr:hypothetical protein [Vicinamibacteria bacterium]